MTTAVTPPLIDIAPLLANSADPAFIATADELDSACREVGFFSISGHGANMTHLASLDAECRYFFDLPHEEKDRIAMRHGGPAWRGWFPAGGELTSGVPDRKEGIYFGTELPASDARVVAGKPLHGPNLFPADPPNLKVAVHNWMSEMRAIAESLLRGLSVGLGLDVQYFARQFTAEPTVLFRVFKYAATPASVTEGWGVGEHTDYGLITLLAQDNSGGLQVKSTAGWMDVAPVDGTIVCNLGDMLELMTGGQYRSTPHRVVSPVNVDRLSFPYFFDPGFDTAVAPVLPSSDMEDINNERWDGASPLAFEGTYGDYLMGKVSKVFPELFDSLP